MAEPKKTRRGPGGGAKKPPYPIPPKNKESLWEQASRGSRFKEKYAGEKLAGRPHINVNKTTVKVADGVTLSPQERKLRGMQERAAKARAARELRASGDGLDSLTPIARNFCIEFCYDFNPARAYIRAGGAYASAASNAARLMRNPKIKAITDGMIAERVERLGITGEKILLELAKIAFSNIGCILVVDPATGKVSFDLRNADADTMAAIQEISHDADGNLKVKFADKKGALELLGKTKTLSLFRDSVEATGPNGTPLQAPSLNIVFTPAKGDAIVQASAPLTIEGTVTAPDPGQGG